MNTRVRVKGILGIYNGGPLSPIVEVEGDFDCWLTPNQARSLAKRLVKAARSAETKAAVRKAEPTGGAS